MLLQQTLTEHLCPSIVVSVGHTRAVVSHDSSLRRLEAGGAFITTTLRLRNMGHRGAGLTCVWSQLRVECAFFLL